MAWYKFQRHRKVPTNKHVSIKLRLKLFDAVVTPTILYGLRTLPLTHFQLQKLHALQGRMLRSIVGWVRVGDEPWRMTMHRMKLRVNATLALHLLDLWTRRLALRQHSFASQVVETCGWAMRLCGWQPEISLCNLLAVRVVP